LENNHLVISPIDELEDYSLLSMLSEINDKNIHESFEFGDPIGEELL